MEHKKFREALKRILNTPDGELVFEQLKSMYADSSAYVANDTNTTMYRLGQKELIQALYQDANLQDDTSININSNEENYYE